MIKLIEENGKLLIEYENIQDCFAFNFPVFASAYTTTNMSIQCALWIREVTKSPRIRRNGSFTNTSAYMDDNVYLKLPWQTDISLRVTATTSNSDHTVLGGFDIIQFDSVI